MARKLSLRFKSLATVGVWFMGLVLAAALLIGRPAGDAQGIAWGTPVVISAPEDGVLLELPLPLHSSVRTDQLVARMDPAALLLRSRVLHAELEALSTEESDDALSRTRRFQGDREDARLEQARLFASVAEEEARLAAGESELAREQDLAARGLRPPARAEDLEREVEVIRTRLAAERERLTLAERMVRTASSRAQAAAGPNRWLLVAAEGRLDEVAQRLERLGMKSPIDGQVTELSGAPGEWLEAGQPILRVSPLTTREVHVWTDVHVAREVRVGDRATVRRANGARVEAAVLSVGAERLPLPQSLWYRSDIREWGYLIRVDVTSGDLAPGEPVRVSLRG